MAAGKATAKGAAYDADVITIDNTPEALQEALKAAQAAAARRYYPDQVARLEAKVAKQLAQLEDAEAALAAAKAELADKEAEWAEESD